MSSFINEKYHDVFSRRLKVLVLIAFFVLVWIVIVKSIGTFVVSNVSDNWESMRQERQETNIRTVKDIFDKKQESLYDISKKLSNDETIVKAVKFGESGKLFEQLLSYKLPSGISVEILNHRLEDLAYSGREISFEFFLLQKVLRGEKLSVLKDIGFNTYLILYSPILDKIENDNIVGVLVTAKLLDVKIQIKTKYFPEQGITDEIKNVTSVEAQLFAANTATGQIFIDSLLYAAKSSIDLTGIDGSVIGKILIDGIDQTVYIEEVENLTDRISSILVFVLSLILLVLLSRFLNTFEYPVIRVIVLGLFLVILRFSWLQFGFPSATFDSELFSPVYYASNFGFGIVRSVGELIVTSVFILYFVIYVSRLLVRRSKVTESHNHERKKLYSVLYLSLLTVVFFYLMDVYGEVLQSIIFDSNIKFLDKLTVVPSPELFSIQFVILLLSFSLFVLLTSVLLFNLSIVKSFSRNTSFKTGAFFLMLVLFLFLNQVYDSVIPGASIIYLHRLIIVLSLFVFVFILERSGLVRLSLKFFSLRNFSIVVLVCIIVVPLILLDKITSQETNYVDLIGQKISESENERINFVIVDEISNLSNNSEIESFLLDESKSQRLAFYLWAESKLSSENFRSAIIVLDTSFSVVSDFNMNEGKLNVDSVLGFVEMNFLGEGYKLGLREVIIDPEHEFKDDPVFFDDGEYEDGYFGEDDTDPLIFGNIAVMKNSDENYYIGIVPLEKLDLKNTMFESKIGYLILAIQYETKNFIVPSSIEIFKTYTRDNLLDKLISKPVITEYVNGEIVSTNDADIAKATISSLPMFREQIKFSDKKSAWRIENFNDEKFRTYFILSERITSEEDQEVIYSISLRRDDIKLVTFYYLKFILFTIFLYLIFYVVLGILYLIKLRSIKLNFREKLFVWFFIVSIIPIILLAAYTRGFILNKNEVSLKNQLVSDLNFISESFQFPHFPNAQTGDTSGVSNFDLGRSVTQSDKNFNYFVRNKLVATTNEELYKSDLLDTRVDDDAYYNIVYQNRDLYIKSQDIGTFSYLVGYEPVRDSRNNLTGIVSSQLLFKHNEINEELTETLTFIFGTYIIVIILVLIIVSILSARISKPILELKLATEKLSKGDSKIQIKTNLKDELGDLVRSFNKMTTELERSKRELKKAEREAAWRDIAQRVAHEIKNPLTPMKLSIQHLADVYSNGGKSEFSAVLNKTKQLIINEIDKLNKIATEFSNFAKLPVRNYSAVDVNDVINDVVSLYSADKRISFDLGLSEEKLITKADKQELNRVFQNLIKNSIQSIRDKGNIAISSKIARDEIIVEIKDDGCGMTREILSKLFEPNFSTKSKGMGLGLTITKKSLDDLKAKISFKSEIGKGTTVNLIFRKMKIITEQKEGDN